MNLKLCTVNIMIYVLFFSFNYSKKYFECFHNKKNFDEEHWYIDFIEKTLACDDVDIDELDDSNSTALHIACRLGHYEVAKYLISRGANIHIPTSSGCSIFKELLEKVATNNDSCDLSIIQLLLDHGTDVQEGAALCQLVNSSIETSMNYSLIYMLIKEYNADVNIKDQKGITPIFYSKPNSILFEFLVSEYADLEEKDNNGVAARDYLKNKYGTKKIKNTKHDNDYSIYWTARDVLLSESLNDVVEIFNKFSLDMNKKLKLFYLVFANQNNLLCNEQRILIFDSEDILKLTFRITSNDQEFKLFVKPLLRFCGGPATKFRNDKCLCDLIIKKGYINSFSEYIDICRENPSYSYMKLPIINHKREM